MKISKVKDIRKYTIKEKFDALPYSERSARIERACRQMNISQAQLRKIWSYRITDKNEARPSQLLILAVELGCGIEELFSKKTKYSVNDGRCADDRPLPYGRA